MFENHEGHCGRNTAREKNTVVNEEKGKVGSNHVRPHRPWRDVEFMQVKREVTAEFIQEFGPVHIHRFLLTVYITSWLPEAFTFVILFLYLLSPSSS